MTNLSRTGILRSWQKIAWHVGYKERSAKSTEPYQKKGKWEELCIQERYLCLTLHEFKLM